MRLRLAVLSAAAVVGGYALVSSVQGRFSGPGDGSEPSGRSWSPSVLEEPAPATRTYELIRYVNPDGSLGMVDDPTRVPRGATIVGRERRTMTVATPAAPEAAGPESAPPPERTMPRRDARSRAAHSMRVA